MILAGATLSTATISNIQTLSITASSDISAATITGMTTLLASGSVTLTMTDAQNDLLAGSATVGNTSQQVTLTDAASTTAIAGIETYVLGNFTNSLTLAAAGHSVTGGSSADTVTSTTDMDLSGSTLTNVETVEIGTATNSASTRTLTMDSTTALNGAAVITAASNSDHLHISYGALAGDTAFSLAGSTLFTNSTNASNAILLDSGANTGGAVTLTASAATNFTGGSGTTQIRDQDGVDGTNTNIISSADGLDLSSVLLTDFATVNLDTDGGGAVSLTVDNNTNLDVATIVGNGGDDIIQLADGAVTFSAASNTLTTILEIVGGTGSDSITGSSGADTIRGGTGGDTITGGAGADTIDLGNGGTAGTDADIVAYTAVGDGSATELIKNFVIANDTIQLDISGFSLSAGTGALATANYVEDTQANISGNTGSILNSADITVITFTDSTTAAQAETALATAIGSNGATDMTSVFVVYNDGTDTFLGYDSNAATDSTGFTAMTILDSDNAGTSVTASGLTEADFTLVA